MISVEAFEVLLDILNCTERRDKITIELDEDTNTFRLQYEDLDSSWFSELEKELSGHSG